eukprot:5252019-Alexandrium_andersonii.AAC.1
MGWNSRTPVTALLGARANYCCMFAPASATPSLPNLSAARQVAQRKTRNRTALPTKGLPIGHKAGLELSSASNKKLAQEEKEEEEGDE